jgi:hypothetical protein
VVRQTLKDGRIENDRKNGIKKFRKRKRVKSAEQKDRVILAEKIERLKERQKRTESTPPEK